MGQYRMQRLNGQLRDEISKILLHGDIKDPRVSTFLSINHVEITRDLRYAKVFVSSFLPDAQVEKGVEGLNSAAGFIQCVIAKKLRIYQFPKLTFYVDKAMKDGFRMVETLNELEKQSKERERLAAENHNSEASLEVENEHERLAPKNLSSNDN